MNSYEVYQTYLALKQHFTSDYDYHKYHGKVKANVDSFRSRRDRFFFEKLSKQADPFGFILSNIVSNPVSYPRELAYDEKAKDIYRKWLKTKESLTYVFSTEILSLSSNFNDNFLCGVSDHPHLLRLYLGKKISLETLCILCSLTGCLKYWRNKLKGDPIYDDVEFLVRKYIPFLKFDKEKFTKIIRNNFKETK